LAETGASWLFRSQAAIKLKPSDATTAVQLEAEFLNLTMVVHTVLGR